MQRSIPPNIAAATTSSRTAFQRLWTTTAISPWQRWLDGSAFLELQIELARHPVTASLLGQIERAVAAVDQIRHRLAILKLSDADRYGNLRKYLAGGAAGELALRDRPANALGDRAAR